MTAADRIRAEIAADLRAQAAMCLARAIRALADPKHQGEQGVRWHRRMHRAFIRQAWNVQQLPVRGAVPGRPLSYRVER